MARLLNSKAVISIMNSRILITERHVNRTLELTVQGNGTKVDVTTTKGSEDGRPIVVQSAVEEGTVFQKLIFNTQANSEIAMNSTLNKELLAKARECEKLGPDAKVKYTLNAKQGEKEYTAHELFSAYLNRVQLSFNIPTTAKVAFDISDGIQIAGRIEKITTDNGSLLTVDPKTIRVLEPEVAGKTTFAFDDEEETPAATGEGATLNAKEALAA